MYLVSGCNLFGQWFSSDSNLIGFKNVSVSANENVLKFCKRKPTQIKLSSINWSYNIFQIDDNFYISGSWLGEENQVIKFDMPDDDECRRCVSRGGIQNMLLFGNDYNLFLVNKDTYRIWVLDLEDDSEVKKLSLNIDKPIRTGTKRFRAEDKIVKAIATNSNCLYLTESGVIYSGLVPTHLNVDLSEGSGKVCDIACGYDHCVLLTDSGRVYTWGNGRRLQLGHGDLTNLESPVEVEALGGIKIIKISAGGWHSLALSESGDLYAWGWNDTGQLGIKSQPDNPRPQGVLKKEEGFRSHPQPTLVDLFDENDKEIDLNVKDIGCGSRHSALLLEDNSVWTTGFNKYGQLGFDPEQYAVVNYFKKSYQCKDEYALKCGLWATVLIKDE
ncbi:hypothetical protein O0L34_g8330 [Tuta absoluta]|nr:hypothetical protein O0L34_g8330 [Tuta absoluta]